MNHTNYLHALCAIFLLTFSFFAITCVHPNTLRAETRLTWDNANDTVWTKSGNPYILESSLHFNHKITIQEGVVIMAASTTKVSFWPRIHAPYISAGGGIDMLGTSVEPIRLIGLAPTVIGKSATSKIEHVVFENSPLYLDTSEGFFASPNTGYMGTTTIRSSTMFGSDAPALEVNSGAVIVEDSEIRDNRRGLLSGNTAYKISVRVRNSIFRNNTDYAVRNEISKPIDAVDNWWGRAEGPGDTIVGPVAVAPWKTEDPRPKVAECCSNVLFLPGLQASRLYRDDPDLLGGGTTTHRAWEPFTSNDVRSLFLKNDGTSINPTIRPKDILASAFGVKDIYRKFVAMMNGVVAEKTINEWMPFAYDWRFSPLEIVEPLISHAERLAQDSKTGKVTVVAHSYGGLVAKMLGRELEKGGKGDIIDKVIMVAVPELGTPQAVAGMLHGSDQDLGLGVILKSGVARTWGLTMLGAYSLLPSREYFERIAVPVISLAERTADSYSDFVDFITGKSDGRTQPKESELKIPAVLSSDLVTRSESMHTLLDTWKFPAGTETLSVVGWGMPTTSGIDYFSSSPSLRKNSEGDGTVILGSSKGDIFFNQGLFNRDGREKRWLTATLVDDWSHNIVHSNIFEADPIRDLLSKLVATSTIFSAGSTLPPYLTTTKPNPLDYPWMKWYTVSVHSPVDVDVYDSRGGHMGMIPLPGQSESDIMLFENTIGGHYDALGDEKYFTIPADDTYTITLKGTGIGTFTYQVQEFAGTEMTEVSNTLYTGLPVTPLLVASTTLSSSMLASPLKLDVDGNGTADISAPPSSVVNPFFHLDSMETILRSLGLASSTERDLLKKIDKARKNTEKDKEKSIAKVREMIEKAIDSHWDMARLTEDDRTLLLSSFEALLSALEAQN